jgi:ribosome biogenesis GTPase
MGFNDWFQKRLDQALHSIHQLARVVSVHKDSYVITRGTQEVFAELTGNLLYSADSPLDLPTTGDWVYADFYDNDSHAIIHAVLPRKTLLKRKTSGRKVDFQLVAANIDVAFIIQSLNENFNLNRLERYLVMVNEAGIQPVVLLSKCDLMDADQIARARDQILAVYPGMNLLEFSNLNAFNIDTIRVSLQSGLTYCLLGSSGVGKTTLLNSILGKDEFETRTVSQIQSKGRHTTTTRQLVQLESGAMILDTPGMRELGSLSIEEGLDETFAEIPDIASRCKFTNCSHSNEKGCAIRTAIEAGELSEQRYQNYLKMRRESEFNQMSYLEKRNRDRQFGKMVKNIMQHKKK